MSSNNTVRKWLVRALTLAGVTLFLSVPPALAADPSLAEIRRAFYRGEYEPAATLAEKYLKAHPLNAPARVLLAQSQMAQGKLDRAYRELRKVLRSAPGDIDALHHLARLCLILSQREYQRLYSLAPDSARVHQLTAESYLVEENKAKAEAEFQVALQANPRSAEVLNALGDLKRSQFLFDQAISFYSRAADIAPNDYDSQYGLGAAYLYRKETAKAAEHLRRAIALAPDSAVAHLALGSALLRDGRPAEAVPELNAAKALEPRMRQAYTLLALAYKRLGKVREADEELKKSRELTLEQAKVMESGLASEDEIPPHAADPEDK